MTGLRGAIGGWDAVGGFDGMGQSASASGVNKYPGSFPGMRFFEGGTLLRPGNGSFAANELAPLRLPGAVPSLRLRLRGPHLPERVRLLGKLETDADEPARRVAATGLDLPPDPLPGRSRSDRCDVRSFRLPRSFPVEQWR